MEAAADQLVEVRDNRKSVRRFAMTLNNYTDQNYENLKTRGGEIFKYLIIGKEVAASGTRHLQMYGEIPSKSTILALKRKLVQIDLSLSTIHIEVAVADAATNIAYCSKEMVTYEIGIRPKGQGFRSDISAVVEDIKAGVTMNELADKHGQFLIKYPTGISNYFSRYQKPRNFMTIGYWLFGETGTGKSRWAHEKFPDAFWKDADRRWFDGYQGEETIVIDDYRPTKDLSFQTILRMVDRYPMKVEIKGGYVNFAPKRIIFTTPKSIDDTFRHLEWLGEESIEQLKRRMPHQFQFDGTNHLLANLQLVEQPEILPDTTETENPQN